MVEDGVLRGLGAADMKGDWPCSSTWPAPSPNRAVDVTWCFYACEEIALQFNGLGQLWDERPDLLEADAAILGEPTGGLVEAGCQGTFRATHHGEGLAGPHRPTVHGSQCHPPPGPDPAGGGRLQRTTARPRWVRIRRAAAGRPHRRGRGRQRGSRRGLGDLNHRFAPDRTGDEAIGAIRDLLSPWLEDDDTWLVTEVQPGAPPGLDHPLLAALVAASGAPPRAKVGWTDVASFWRHGVPAANFGPGDPLLAHTPGEFVGRDELEHAAGVLGSLLTEG